VTEGILAKPFHTLDKFMLLFLHFYVCAHKLAYIHSYTSSKKRYRLRLKQILCTYVFTYVCSEVFYIRLPTSVKKCQHICRDKIFVVRCQCIQFFQPTTVRSQQRTNFFDHKHMCTCVKFIFCFIRCINQYQVVPARE
jgi:hypothetical protein